MIERFEGVGRRQLIFVTSIMSLFNNFGTTHVTADYICSNNRNSPIKHSQITTPNLEIRNNICSNGMCE